MLVNHRRPVGVTIERMSTPVRRFAPWFALLTAAACGTHGRDVQDVQTQTSDDAAAPAERRPLTLEPPNDRAPGDAGEDAAERDAETDAPNDADPWAHGPPLGARKHANGDLEVRVLAPNATRIEVALFARPRGDAERVRVPLERDGDRHRVRIARARLEQAGIPADATLYYGLRVFGPNWPWDPAFQPGTTIGFIADVDGDGHRMNPNKLVLDPYALEVSHDPIGPGYEDNRPFRTGESLRAIDSGPSAPKGIVLDVGPPAPRGPARPLVDEVIYEVHLRGLTAGDTSLPAGTRGTYAAARARAKALRALGVTAVEFLPLHETPNDQNDLRPNDARGQNYWGYSTLSFFAPDRRYASDRSPGGPTRELRDMIAAFHDEGLKVYVDVVYNHTSEGGANGGAATILSFRGLDNATFYQLAANASGYVNSNGVGPNVNTANPVVGDLVLHSLRYWHEQLGVDGFRFDLASIVANGCTRSCYRFDAAGLPERIAKELARPRAGGVGVDLIAEPWGVVDGSYQLGRFPLGWAEWNDVYRDTVRRDLNRLGTQTVTLRELARRIGGSRDRFDARGPGSSINFVTAHDGFTLRDLFAFDRKVNDQPWPWGPSDGGNDWEIASRHGGDVTLQRRCARTALGLLLLSHGVPMILGGDEHLRTQQGNNNTYNVDSPANWLDPKGPVDERAFFDFARRLLAFRSEHRALRSPRHVLGIDGDRDGQPALALYRDDGMPASDAYLDAEDRHFLSWVFEGDELGDRDAAIWVAYNGWSGTVVAQPPPAPPGTRWHLFADTSERGSAHGYAHTPGAEPVQTSFPYAVDGRALTVFVAR
jgi:glycogen operon protein